MQINQEQLEITTHWKELKYRIGYTIISGILTIIVVYTYKENAIDLITNKIFGEEEQREIIYISISEALRNYIKISIWISIIMTIPMMIGNIYLFIRSGLYKYKAERIEKWIKGLIIGWIPINEIGITEIWPKVAKWFRSYGDRIEEKIAISYLPTMEEYYKLIYTWTTMWIIIWGIIIIGIMRIQYTDQPCMIWYERNREKGILGILIISGGITPPDVITQIIGSMIIIGIIELMVIGEKSKEAFVAQKAEQLSSK